MSSQQSDHHLGGRLPLLGRSELTPEQARLHARFVETRGPIAEAAGIRIADDQGRLIGPFNAYLRVPPIADAISQWGAAINARGLPDEVREVTILTTVAAFHSEFATYAHAAEARHAGVSDADVEALVAGEAPRSLSPAAAVAHRLARALAVEHAVDDATYAEAVQTFGVEDVIALASLVGRYMATAALLATFKVPAP
jgi:4-carboxymuconolactone decarboxylase